MARLTSGTRMGAFEDVGLGLGYSKWWDEGYGRSVEKKYENKTNSSKNSPIEPLREKSYSMHNMPASNTVVYLIVT